LFHKPSHSYFLFDNSVGFYSLGTPGDEKQFEYENSENWGQQLLDVVGWLSYVKRETEQPDFWAEVSKEAQILESAASSNTSNAQFTADEKKYILNGLDEIRQYLLTAHRLDPELVESRLKYLAESSDRVGRKDWLNLLISFS
jgi:hypothetical protein